MKTILIPTDFNEQSVKTARLIPVNSDNEKIKIIFFHAYKLTDSISDLLMLRRRTAEYGQIPDAFHTACNQFKLENEATVYSVGIEYFYGSTMAAFRNFIEANEVDAIFYPGNYNFQKISKYSLDPELLLKKSGLPVIQPQEIVQPTIEKVLHSQDQPMAKDLNNVSEMA